MLKKIALVAGSILLVLIVAAWAYKARRDARYFDNYDPRAPLNFTLLDTQEVGKETPEKGYTLAKFTFDGYAGEKVPALLSFPLNKTREKYPVIVFLHGIGQKKDFLREITVPFNQCGFAFASFDQYMQGERKLPKNSGIPAFLKAFQQRPAKTVNEARRLVDYLLTRPDIDPQRIYLCGASYGAVTGSTVLAKDKRIRAGALVYGGGDFRKLLNSQTNHLAIAALLRLIDAKNIDPEKTPLPKLTTFQECCVWPFLQVVIGAGRYFAGAADPIHYAAGIAPTPVLFQNGLHDCMVPAAAGKALQDAAKEPKKIAWYDSDHVGLDIEHTKLVLAEGLRWFLEQDDPFRAPAEKVDALPAFDTLEK